MANQYRQRLVAQTENWISSTASSTGTATSSISIVIEFVLASYVPYTVSAVLVVAVTSFLKHVKPSFSSMMSDDC
uniref:Uncharacterized protein n=1 Tax=Glossina palpalis gambiensis TaxID=67801 RepID=A0A1B0B2G6_9MUSC